MSEFADALLITWAEYGEGGCLQGDPVALEAICNLAASIIAGNY